MMTKLKVMTEWEQIFDAQDSIKIVKLLREIYLIKRAQSRR